MNCGGGVPELPVIEGCLCGLLNACERTQDVDRAQQWLGAADEVISVDLLAGSGLESYIAELNLYTPITVI